MYIKYVMDSFRKISYLMEILYLNYGNHLISPETNFIGNSNLKLSDREIFDDLVRSYTYKSKDRL